MIEFIGYTGSVLVAISLMMSNIKKLRWINLFGAVLFSTYGLLIKAYPVFILNLFISLADIYYIVQMTTKKDIFSFWEISFDNPYLDKFLEYYSADISVFFPSFRKQAGAGGKYIFILRNLLPVGLFAYEELGKKIDVKIDYAVPEYRDLKNAKYIYSNEAGALRKKGFEYFSCSSDIDLHKRYLMDIGFEEQKDRPGNFLKKI